MSWIVGLDLRPESDGAVLFGEWLQSRGEDVIGIHVVESTNTSEPVVRDYMYEIMKGARQIARDRVSELGAGEAFGSIEVSHGSSAEHGLASAASEAGASGLVIGRRARRGQRPIVRLGRVARRLLRELPVPVIVTPPDLQRQQIGGGPIVLASDLTPNSTPAGEFAQTFARTCDRPLLLVHVVPVLDEVQLSYVPADLRSAFRNRAERAKQADVETWARDLGIETARIAIARGDAAEAIAGVAADEGAPLIVCGSRMLTLNDRILLSSVGSALAGTARCAVAVVPPTPP